MCNHFECDTIHLESHCSPHSDHAGVKVLLGVQMKEPLLVMRFVVCSSRWDGGYDRLWMSHALSRARALTRDSMIESQGDDTIRGRTCQIKQCVLGTRSFQLVNVG